MQLNFCPATVRVELPYVKETIERRRSAALLSGFGLGHVREDAPSTLVGPWGPTCTLPSSSGLASHPSFKVLAHLNQMCENGTPCNSLSNLSDSSDLPDLSDKVFLPRSAGPLTRGPFLIGLPLHSIDDGSEGTLTLVLLLSCIEAVGDGKCYSWHHPLRGGQLCVLSYQPYFHR